jgi:hypothetical protein
MRGLSNITSGRAFAVSAAAVLVPLTLMRALPFPALYTVYFCHMVLPYAMLFIGTVAGIWPFLLSLCIGVTALYLSAGMAGAALGAVYLAPVAAVYLYCFKRGVPFFKTAAVLAAAFFLGQLAVFIALQMMLGWKLYERAADAMAQGVIAMPEGESLLYLLHVYGILPLPADLANNLLVETATGFRLADAARTALIGSLRSMADAQLRGYIPESLVSHSLLAGIGGTALALHWGAKAAHRRAFKRDTEAAVPDLNMTPFEKWFMPRGFGLRVGILAAGYPLALYASGQESLQLAGQMMFAAFSALYMLQGLSALSGIQRKRGQKAFWRWAAAVGLLLLLQQALVVIGVADQLMDFRGLRPKPASNGTGRNNV